jgi:hypothetical protein
MTLGFVNVLDSVVSHAMSLGVFGAVNQHEPSTAPGPDITAAVWVDYIGPAESGLASTSVKLVLNLRIYQNSQSDPQDAIDPAVVNAVDLLMEAYNGDFTLGGLARQVDILGHYGPPLSASAGYLRQGDTLFRTMTLTLPIILNDVWAQVA